MRERERPEYIIYYKMRWCISYFVHMGTGYRLQARVDSDCYVSRLCTHMFNKIVDKIYFVTVCLTN